MKSCESGSLDKAKFKLTRMLYACGQGADLYRVDSVIYTKNDEAAFYENKEIIVEFELGNDDTAMQLLKKSKCPSCFNYICDGDIFRMETGMLKMKVNILELQERPVYTKDIKK